MLNVGWQRAIEVESFKKYPMLRVLILGFSNVNGDALGQVAQQHSKLITLGLEGLEGMNRGVIPLAKLKYLESINLGGSDLTDQGISYLCNIATLKSIQMNGTGITDAGVKTLAGGLPQFDGNLQLVDTQVTDASISHFIEMTHLKKLNVTGTTITPDGISQLKNALPNCEIVWRERSRESERVSVDLPRTEGEVGRLAKFTRYGQKSYGVLPIRYDGSHPLTVEAWVTPLDHGGYVVSDVKDSAGIGLCIHDRHWHFSVHRGGEAAQAVSDQPVALFEPVHLAGVLVDGELSLFVNGVRQNVVGKVTNELVFGDNPLHVGNRALLYEGDQLRGFIDNLHISKTARYKEAFVPSKAPKSDDNTLGLYLFNEDGEKLIDSSARRNHGGMVGVKRVEHSEFLKWTEFAKRQTDSASDLSAARRVLELGGTVEIATNEGRVVVAAGETLPSSRFRLTGIDLSGQELQSHDLSFLGDLPDLESLNVSDTGLDSEGLRYIGRANSLEDLHLGRNKGIDSAAMTELQHSTSLVVLSLNYTNVGDAGIANLPNARGMASIYIAWTACTNDAVRHLQRFPNLQTFSTDGTSITGSAFPLLVASHPYLGRLQLQGLAEADQAAEALQSLKYLGHLDARGSDLTDTGLVCLSRIPALRSILVGGTKVTDEGIKGFVNAKEYANPLDLHGTAITDEAILYLSRIRVLNLSVKDTQITDASIPHFIQMTHLKRLNVTGTKITPEGIAKLRNALPECEIADAQ